MEEVNNLLKTMDKELDLKSDDRVLVAYSGGVDSALLLELLFQYQKERGFFLAVFHLHHGIRKDSDAEEDHVKKVCETYGLPLYLEHVDTPRFKEEEKLSLEEAARELRYGAIEKVMKDEHFHYVALGHHLDDQLETFFLNLFRGSGLTGLTGMRVKEGEKLRPLLHLKKEEVYHVAETLGLTYVEDYTNDEVIYKRNKIRKELIPHLLEHYDPSLYEHLERTMNILREEDDYLTSHLSGYPLKRHYKLEELRSMDERLLGRYLRLLIDHVVGLKNVTFKQVESLKRLVTGSTQGELIIKGARFSKEQEDFFIHLSGEESFDPITLKEGMNDLPDMTLELYYSNNYEGDFTLNREDVVGDLVIRPRREGDKIRIAPTQTKDVRVLFIDKKIPRSLRPSVKLLCDEKHVFWIMGYRKAFSKKKTGDYICLKIHK